VELIGAPPPSPLMRAPSANAASVTKEFVEDAALKSPAVVAANAVANASRYDAQSARASNYPSITVGLDAGRYGALENAQDYDVRGNITLRQRLFGGMLSRENQAEARARSAEARATRVRVETVRDASIAWSDVEALQTELSAIESSYVSTRKSREILIERFDASRGTLFDVLSANDNLFQAAATFVRTLSELDTARYALLSKTGRLLSALEIEAEREQMR
jgi:adhesin transport system outer membrane protein